MTLYSPFAEISRNKQTTSSQRRGISLVRQTFWRACNTDCHPFCFDHWQISIVPMPPTPLIVGVALWGEDSKEVMRQTPVAVRNTRFNRGNKKWAATQLCNCYYSNLANHPCTLSSIPEPSNIISNTISKAVGHAALLTLCCKKRSQTRSWQCEQWMTSASSVFSWDKVGACTPSISLH